MLGFLKLPVLTGNITHYYGYFSEAQYYQFSQVTLPVIMGNITNTHGPFPAII
jgi:hypothetical protein